jgi:hypothetical protein
MLSTVCSNWADTLLYMAGVTEQGDGRDSGWERGPAVVWGEAQKEAKAQLWRAETADGAKRECGDARGGDVCDARLAHEKDRSIRRSRHARQLVWARRAEKAEGCERRDAREQQG